ESGAAPVHMIASVAPPALPFDGREATPLAQRYARDLSARAGQASLTFGAPPPASSSPSSPRAWVAQVRQAATDAAQSEEARREPDRAAGALDRAERGPDGGPDPRAGPRAAEAPARGWGSDPGPAFDEALAAAARAFEAAEAAAPAGYFSQLRYLGQLDLTYLACEGDGELVLVDQHAAHERVELARLRERHARDGDARVAVQNMLFPVTLEATPAQLALVARVGDLLAQVGFEVEPFGKATLALKAVPAGIRPGDRAQLLRRLLHEWAEAGAPSEAERLDALLGTIACHSVVRAGDRLTPGEVETLLRSLDGIDLSLPAPHGRAVLLRLPLSEIGRRFGRS